MSLSAITLPWLSTTSPINDDSMTILSAPNRLALTISLSRNQSRNGWTIPRVAKTILVPGPAAQLFNCGGLPQLKSPCSP